MNIGEKIRELRNEKNLLQRDFAEKIGIAPNTLSQFETGKANPSYFVLCQMADFFEVSTDYLLGRSDDFGNIALPSEFLSEREKELVKNYRALSESKKELIEKTIAMFDTAEKAERR